MYLCIFAPPPLPPILLLPSFPTPHLYAIPPCPGGGPCPGGIPGGGGPPPPAIIGPAPGCWDCTSGRLLPRKDSNQQPLSPRRQTCATQNTEETRSYLKSCMKWQIGHATSLYLCVASGITGYSSHSKSAVYSPSPSPNTYPPLRYAFSLPPSPPNFAHKSARTHTTKHTVNHGHLVIQCALQLPPISPQKRKLLASPLSFRFTPRIPCVRMRPHNYDTAPSRPRSPLADS